MELKSSLQGTYVGQLIAASFGLVFIWANSGSLNPGLRFSTLAIAVAAVLIIVAAFWRTLQNWSKVAPEVKAARFNKPFWVIVLIEAIALLGGRAIISQMEPSAALGWIALVVGLHLIALAVWWLRAEIGILVSGIALTLLGVAGLVIGFLMHQVDTVALVSGVGSGMVLVGTSLVAAIRTFVALYYTPEMPSRISDASDA